MKRKELEDYIVNRYGTVTEHPWEQYPEFSVFRRTDNRKWFAVIMEIPKSKIGIEEEGNINVVNLKSDPLLIGSLLFDSGIHPAYHMNKNHWVSALLSDISDDLLKYLVNISFDITKSNLKKVK